MKTIIVTGLQWGDEGKGKVVDRMATEADAVARFHGGHNAGHTVYHNGDKVILHIIPSGALHAHTKCFIGPGVVVSPTHLFEELKMLASHNISLDGRLFISPLAPLLLECHQRSDVAREKSASNAIGTTGRGIGPAYEDRAARRGVVVGDLRDMDVARTRLKELFEYHNFMLTDYYKSEAIDIDKALAQLEAQRDDLLAMADGFETQLEACRSGKSLLLLEGAQGAMLDIIYGTYPFVTSSHTIGAYAPVGLGIPPHSIDMTVGVVKAYTTRVGHGDFPTELDVGAGDGKHLSERGHEIGATTGRTRRCGWLDLVAVKRMVDLGGVNALCITKLDVLDGMEVVRCCQSYDASGKPEYAELPGWDGSSGVRELDKLPAGAKAYIKNIEQFTQCPVKFISTGVERDDSIIADGFLSK